MSNLWVCVAMKFGDVCNVLPIIYKEFHATNQKQNVLVASKYLPILTGCSYAVPVEWKGEWSDVDGAAKSVEGTDCYIKPVSTMFAGKKFAKETPSFCYEQYRLCGDLENFDNLPLVFDKRSPEREEKLVKETVGDSKFILIGDRGESSPFAKSDDLVELISKKFKKFKVVRLSEVKADFIYDLIGLYDKAMALISTETVHLHLSRASNVPVIALTTNKPERWHGTAFQKRFHLQIRYSDYDSRKGEIVDCLKTIIAGIPKPDIRLTGIGGYNMTLAATYPVYRFHPDKKSWRTILAINDGGRVSTIETPKEFEGYSFEDARFFSFNGTAYLSYTLARTVEGHARCVIQYAQLRKTADGFRLANPIQPKYGKNDFSSMEKNWTFYAHNNRLYCFYQRSPEQIVLEMDGDTVVKELKTKPPKWDYGDIRGGTHPIEYNGLLLQFFHSQKKGIYYVGALLMESTPPFQIVSVSSRPIFTGNETWIQGQKFWKGNVTIAYGATKLPNGFYVCGGFNDCATFESVLKEKQLFL